MSSLSDWSDLFSGSTQIQPLAEVEVERSGENYMDWASSGPPLTSLTRKLSATEHAALGKETTLEVRQFLVDLLPDGTNPLTEKMRLEYPPGGERMNITSSVSYPTEGLADIRAERSI